MATYKYTLEEAERMRQSIKDNPKLKQYYTPKQYEIMACTTQEQLDLLRKYHEASDAIVNLASDTSGRLSGEQYMSLYNDAIATFMSTKNQLSSVLSAADKQMTDVFWTEGGAGAGTPETPVPQATVNLGGQEYYQSGGGYVAAPTTPTQQGTWQTAYQNALNSGATPEQALQAANQAALWQPTQTATSTASTTATPTSQGTWQTAYQNALNSGATPEQALQAANQSLYNWGGAGTQAYATPEGYTPTGAGVGMPLVSGGTQPTTSGTQGTWQIAYQNALNAGYSPEQALQKANESLSQYYWGEGAITPTDLTMQIPEGGFNVDQYLMPEGMGGVPSIPDPSTWPEGFIPVWDSNWMTYVWEYHPEVTTEEDKISVWQQAQLDLEYSQQAATQSYQQQQLELQKQQQATQEQYYNWQQAESERQYKAQLAAQPASWLQYSAYTGEQPVVQPWMQPMLPATGETAEIGQPIPGWNAENMTGIPTLTTPSRQYQARIGPTALQQYYGYQQAQTGAPKEETQWRLWNRGAPGGSFSGLTYSR